MDNWKYYNNAIVPTTYPIVDPDVSALQDKHIWKKFKKEPFFARWTTNFDCGHETNWWYVIKDTPFDISVLKSKRRYEINRGIKNFDIKQIDPVYFAEELFNITLASYATYPNKYRPSLNRELFLNSTVFQWQSKVVIGAFYREKNQLVGFALLSKETRNYVDFTTLKVIPDYEKLSVNAALVEGVLKYFDSFLRNGGVLCDGARNILHETGFQDYLEKLFGFRKAYCKLHIFYNPKVKLIIKFLYPFRKVLILLNSIGIFHKINGILKMEELVREQNE